MISVLGTILAFIIVFGVLVFVHEFGHFFMAKLVGINVETFSFGYGKRLFGIKVKGTDYRISLIPMGGYVKFAGEEALEGLKGSDVEPKPGDFLAASRWQRFLVILCGPVMNLVLAIVLVAIINMVGVSVPIYQDQAPVIGWIDPDSPAERAELLEGDEILNINGKRTATWNDVDMAVGTRPEKTISLDIKRGAETFTTDLTTESITRYEMGWAGFYGRILVEVVMVFPNQPADKAGFKSKDIVLEIDGKRVYYWQFVEALESSPDKELDVLIERDGEQMHLYVTPKKEGNVGKIGVSHRATSTLKKYGFFKSFGQSWLENKKLLFAVVDFIKNLMTGEASTRQLGGPIEIANFSYVALQMGMLAMMSWIAFISLQLGIINLVPVPVFDGGQI
ncbi:MAG: RIP metalloprotease RseP, partial [Candidatus Aminicenantes bacterium]|nr:RIP metalloprotease RseP [Candidatus Aminicenantes bacterium]